MYKTGDKVRICQGDPEEFSRRTGIAGEDAEGLSQLPYLTIKSIDGKIFNIEEDGGIFDYLFDWIDSLYNEPDLFEAASDEDFSKLFS